MSQRAALILRPGALQKLLLSALVVLTVASGKGSPGGSARQLREQVWVHVVGYKRDRELNRVSLPLPSTLLWTWAQRGTWRICLWVLQEIKVAQVTRMRSLLVQRKLKVKRVPKRCQLQRDKVMKGVRSLLFPPMGNMAAKTSRRCPLLVHMTRALGILSLI